MSKKFYRALEDRYRGTRELIKERLNVYLPFVEPLLKAYPSASALDLGCGRGEWLELLIERGLVPLGIDLDEGMLSSCTQLNLPVQLGDAIDLLAKLPADSQVVISAFHLVEHITFDQLQILASESIRVLKKGGLLIMETPNPENISVSSCNFYLDPTHLKPVPPMLLGFVAEFAGFSRIKILRLQESIEVANRELIGLRDVISGVSPDYAVIAQKLAADDIMSLNGHPFDLQYGSSFTDLSRRYDLRLDSIEGKVNECHEQLAAILTSTSWRITKPLRWLMDRIKRLNWLYIKVGQKNPF